MSLHRSSTLFGTLVVAAALGLALWAGQPAARGDGVSGKTQSATGCSCHSTTPNAAVTVVITGPAMVAPGSTNSYTITVGGGVSGTTGGFDLAATGGTLVPGIGSKLLNNELVQADNTHRSWTFDWTAPAVAGVVNLYAIGLSSNGNSSSGDSWNFAGGALNAPFAVDVNPLVAVPDPSVAGLWLGPSTPNPARSATSVQYTLPVEGNVALDIVAASGRHVATIVDAAQSAGPHVAHWDGRDDAGSSAPSGLYFWRLRAGTLERAQRLILVR